MASYIAVPRDLTKVKSKVMFNLTKRQLVCFSLAALIGVPSFFLAEEAGRYKFCCYGNDGPDDAYVLRWYVSEERTATGSHPCSFYPGEFHSSQDPYLSDG